MKWGVLWFLIGRLWGIDADIILNQPIKHRPKNQLLTMGYWVVWDYHYHMSG